MDGPGVRSRSWASTLPSNCPVTWVRKDYAARAMRLSWETPVTGTTTLCRRLFASSKACWPSLRLDVQRLSSTEWPFCWRFLQHTASRPVKHKIQHFLCRCLRYYDHAQLSRRPARELSQGPHP